jgi:hypothetical protein
MPRNDRSDSLSVRGQDDPRRPVKALAQDAERELGWSQAHDTGGVEHQSPDEREGRAPGRQREPKEGGPRRAAGSPAGNEPDDAPLAPEKREEDHD